VPNPPAAPNRGLGFLFGLVSYSCLGFAARSVSRVVRLAQFREELRSSLLEGWLGYEHIAWVWPAFHRVVRFHGPRRAAAWSPFSSSVYDDGQS
jgi:hypothetical protein